MYTTQANVEAKLGTTLTDDQASYFINVLSPAIDRYIERETGMIYGSTTAVSVYVDGTGTGTLIIPTMNTITAVARVNTDGTEEAISVDDYSTYPRGDTDKYALRHLNGTWEEGIENYKVTGKSGASTVPADIVMVATELAINALNESNTNYKSESVGDWSATYAETNKSISDESRNILLSKRRLSRSI